MFSAVSPSQLIYLPKSLVAGENPDYFEIVYSVVVFTGKMMTKGMYRPDELPKNVMMLYWTDYYFGQVMNGGHSQLIENTIDDELAGSLAYAITTAREGFAAMGADSLSKPLARLADWLSDGTFLQRFAEEEGYDDDAWEFLEELDSDLVAAAEESPIDELEAKWLLGWENLILVEDDQLAVFREEQLNSNPRLTLRH